VADIRAGSGYFTVRFSRAVGSTGKVWVIDIRQALLDYIEKRLAVEKLGNVQLLKVAPDDPQLPPGGVDTVVMVDTLHYVQNRSEYARKLRAGLSPGGRVVIIDYIPKPIEQRPWGPPPEQQMSRDMRSQKLGARSTIASEFGCSSVRFWLHASGSWILTRTKFPQCVASRSKHRICLGGRAEARPH
jgi:ubiquinone/menaquinone biosynthesis C-methylase UbiE